MSKKTWILIASLVLSLTLGLGGSLAYLTDTDTKVNTFTMGNVDIEVDEFFGEENDDTMESIRPGLTVKKEAKIKNIGNNDAYVWMTIAVPYELKDVLTLNFPEGTDAVHLEGKEMTVGTAKYWAYVIGREGILAPEEETDLWLEDVTLSKDVDIIDGNYHVWENNEAKDLGIKAGDFEVIVSGYAIQAEGITGGLTEAMSNYYGQRGNENVLSDVEVKVDTEAEVNEALAEGGTAVLYSDIGATATLNMSEGSTLDGAGKTITSEAKHAIKVADGTINNVVLKGTSTYGIYVTGSANRDVTIEDVVVDGPGYTLNAQGGKNGGKLEVYNSHLNGWTSYSGFDSVFFHNTYFDANSTRHWANKTDKNGVPYPEYCDYYLRPYVTSEFSNCWFKEGFCFDLSEIELEKGESITFTDCVYPIEGGEAKITAENIESVLNFDGSFDASKIVFNNTNP